MNKIMRWLAIFRKNPNRKERRQISFRVNDDEYAKLQQSAETLGMKCAKFCEEEAGSRLISPKFDKEMRQMIARI
ncbi:plasmid mobilization protein [Bacillus cereus]